MKDADYVLVFDLLDSGYKAWEFPAFGLIFIAVGILLVAYPRQAGLLFPFGSGGRFQKYFARFWLGFSILWTLFSFGGTYFEYWSLRNSYLAGNAEIVSGPVENFSPMPFEGHQRESYTVAGQRFSYSDYAISSAYNQTRSHGSPIDSGVHVRIHHIRGKIVKLEINKASLSSRP